MACIFRRWLQIAPCFPSHKAVAMTGSGSACGFSASGCGYHLVQTLAWHAFVQVKVYLSPSCQRFARDGILKATELDLCHVIGRDCHLDQSHDRALGRSLCLFLVHLSFHTVLILLQINILIPVSRVDKVELSQ